MGGKGGAGCGYTVQAISPGAASVLGSVAAAQWSAVYASEVAANSAVNTGHLTWQSVLGGLIGVYSIVQQHQLNKRMTDYAERNVVVAENYYQLALTNYNDIVRPAYDRSEAYWDHFVSDLQSYEVDFATAAFANTTWTPDYVAQQGRAVAGVQRGFDIAIRQASRSVGPYHTGMCCSTETMINIARGHAVGAIANAAYRHEDEKKIRMEDIYFDRKTAGVSAIAGVSGNAASMLTGSVSNSARGLDAVGRAASAGGEAYGQMANATASMSDFWGSIGNGAFSFMGYSGFDRAGWGQKQSPFGSGAMSGNRMTRGRGFTGSGRGGYPKNGAQAGPVGWGVPDGMVSSTGVANASYNTGTFL